MLAQHAPRKTASQPTVLRWHSGYKQELKRDFNLFTNTAISFSIISILTGITGELPRLHPHDFAVQAEHAAPCASLDCSAVQAQTAGLSACVLLMLQAPSA
jgi:hypothetical protein